MEKEYISINRNTYNKLAKEYDKRTYAVTNDFYINIMFKDLEFKTGKKILEIGPGRGERLKNFLDYGMDVTAIELSEEMAKLSHSRAPEAKIINKNVFDVDFTDEFDYIYMEAMIHNFPLKDAHELLSKVSRWIKKDGIVICTTTVDKQDFEGYEEKTDYNNKEKRFRHRYTDESFDKLFSDTGFKIIDKKYKEEKDELRTKIWQIVYLKKNL